jgi:hypothetical protein
VRARADVEKRAQAVCRPQSRRRAACRGHARPAVNTLRCKHAQIIKRKVIQRKPGNPLSGLLDDLPILVINELETLGQQADGGDDGAHDARKRRRPDHVNEQAIARLIGFVERLV